MNQVQVQVSRVAAAAFAVNVLKHSKVSVAAAFGVSPRTLGRMFERRLNDVRQKLDEQYEGKVSRRRVYVVTECQRTGRA